MNVFNTFGSVYKIFEVMGSVAMTTIYSSLNDSIHLKGNLIVFGNISNYDNTTTITSKLSKKLDIDLYGSSRYINITGNGALFIFQSNKLLEVSYDIMKLDI